ncbi:hypothetical protein NBT05_12315 [Aquimarina sp. ERC-38]|uniref:imm11 family protein n=1 Tax=Aquimarina sp. ERC-38 TaxID=2949996 RepID=UPI002245ABD9|nr:DUF1629 domain-containing protein [Aquimarina sp. ERC-38]UZO79732.1 hypothetical protein NBT05_12315 [Aquimarina sp. ERC-38]
MKYFSIQHSWNPEILGSFPQSDKAVMKGHVDDEDFIGNWIQKKVPFDNPNIPDIVLKRKAKLTDLLHAPYDMGYVGCLIISEDFRKVLETFSINLEDFQFFKIKVKYKILKNINYYYLHPAKVNYDAVDYPKSEIFITSPLNEYKDLVSIESAEHYIRYQEELRKFGWRGTTLVNLRIENLVVNPNLKEHIFCNPFPQSGMYFVSDNLRSAMEESKLTGIEFFPSELKLKDYQGENGYRKKMYNY